MNERIDEVKFSNSEFKPISKLLYDTNKSICKIITPDNRLATGFLIKIENNNYLITSNNIISEEMINLKKEIVIYYDNQNKTKNIKLDKNIRFIQDYKYLNIDAIVIGISPDNISDYFFLLPNLNYLKGYEQFKYENINVINITKGSEINYKSSQITKINKDLNEFTYYSKRQYDSVGCPIFLENSTFVLGIHKKQINNKERIGNFIGPIINSLKNNYINDIKKYDTGIYEGEFLEKKREGFGKYSFNNNNYYYIGQWKNDKINGKGKLFNNNELIYEGEFVNYQFEGNGKYIYQDGSFYIGQFLNNKKHGKGILYYKNGNIKYDGYFVFDNFVGNGKYIYEDGAFYYGNFLNNKKNGKGILYNKNGTIKYIGDFKDDKYEGEGKYIYGNGMFYIGQWKNNKKNGKGKLFNKKNNIIEEGDFVEDVFKCCIF